MKFRLPETIPKAFVVPGVFAIAAVLCFALSIWTVDGIERFSKLGVRMALGEAGHDWVAVQADGLQVILTGTAPTEAMRFQALAIAGNIVDAARVRDQMAVADQAGIAAPEYSIEILRNDDGISLIGLAPASMDREALVTRIQALVDTGDVTDMMELTDHPAPANWDRTVGFAVRALEMLPRSKISVAEGKVAITAISDSPAEKTKLERELRRQTPTDVRLSLDISAPRPVIAPFTLRFLVDENGVRFDACSADSEDAQRRILAAAAEAGARRDAGCTVGLGVPTPEWADAVIMGLRAISSLGNGSITFSDADVSLIAGPDVDQAEFDRVVGELESNLPEVFSLAASVTPSNDGTAETGASEFVARLSEDGHIELSGRLPDELIRESVDAFARARFGSNAVHAAIRLDGALPKGWPERVLVGLEALAELTKGAVVIRQESLRVEGVTGSKEASDTIARILSSKLGKSGRYDLAIRYEATLDPTQSIPSAEECVDEVNSVLDTSKIRFEPGSAIIEASANPTLDRIAETLRDCGDYPMEVGGHTDSQGREEMNLSLSEQRARSVIIALQSRRVLTGNLSAKGYGETVPIMANDTEENRERNRRIEFRLLSESSDSAEAGPANVQTPTTETIRPKKRPKDN